MPDDDEIYEMGEPYVPPTRHIDRYLRADPKRAANLTGAGSAVVDVTDEVAALRADLEAKTRGLDGMARLHEAADNAFHRMLDERDAALTRAERAEAELEQARAELLDWKLVVEWRDRELAGIRPVVQAALLWEANVPDRDTSDDRLIDEVLAYRAGQARAAETKSVVEQGSTTDTLRTAETKDQDHAPEVCGHWYNAFETRGCILPKRHIGGHNYGFEEADRG